VRDCVVTCTCVEVVLWLTACAGPRGVETDTAFEQHLEMSRDKDNEEGRRLYSNINMHQPHAINKNRSRMNACEFGDRAGRDAEEARLGRAPRQ
jgi:hypothetical protein